MTNDKYIGAKVEDYDGCTYTVVSYDKNTELYLIKGTKDGGRFKRYVSFAELSSYFIVSIPPYRKGVF